MKVAFLTTDNREHLKNYDVPDPCFGPAPGAVLCGMNGLPGIEVHVISVTREPLLAPQKLGPNIWYHSIVVPKIGWLTTGYQGCIRAVRRKIREIQPDIVHGQGTERDCAMEAVFSGYPNVLTIHGNMGEVKTFLNAGLFSYHWFAEKLEKWTLAKTNGVFCNSHHTEELIAPYGRRYWRVPNALRLPFFSPHRNPQTTSSRKIINIGAICAYKRQVEILDVAEQLHSDGVDVEFLFLGGLGNDEYGRSFKERIARAEKAGYARYIGVLDADKMIGLLDECGAIVHFSCVESFGLVVAEGLARNLKLFASRIGGIVDIASGVEGAELYEAEDWQGLRQGIAMWVKAGCCKPEKAAELMVNRYHPTVIARQHLEIYKEVVGVC